VKKSIRYSAVGAGLVTAVSLSLVLSATAQAHTPVQPSRSAHVTVMRGHLVEVSETDFDTGFVSMDNDYAINGTQIGSDVTTCGATNAAGTQARCDVALALRDGIIDLTFTAPGDPEYGVVTGGSGRYAHVAGRVRIVEGNNDDNGPSTADWTITLVS
jgi:hypothetical protein